MTQPLATLSEVKNPGTKVEFMFAPEKIKVSHSSDTNAVKKALGIPVKKPPGTSSAGTGSTGSSTLMVSTDGNPVTVDPGDTILSFNDLILDGARTLAAAQQLMTWTHPEVKAANSAPMEVPLLSFSWGSFSIGGPYDPLYLVLTKVDIEYTRFTSSGSATRATISLGCKVKAQAPGKQNPTSGGDPDRSGRRVTAGENIQGITRETYGDPRRWRQVAEINGIDDPLRVRAGDMLYLPGPAELGRTAR
ncbi:MAG TPA: hypothetical protein VGG05_23740 [Pseudonocardiaceae bacterium]